MGRSFWKGLYHQRTFLEERFISERFIPVAQFFKQKTFYTNLGSEAFFSNSTKKYVKNSNSIYRVRN